LERASTTKHAVEIHCVRGESVETYFAAMCDCGWVDVPLDDERQARESALRHSPNVDPEVKYPLDPDYSPDPGKSLEPGAPTGSRVTVKSVAGTAAFVAACLLILINGIASGDTAAWLWGAVLSGLVLAGGALVHEVQDLMAGGDETRMAPSSARALLGYAVLWAAGAVLYELAIR
jgi:hypothetical protein